MNLSIFRKPRTLALPGIAIAAAVVWEFGSLALAPRLSVVAPAVSPARDLEITATDGLKLAATFRPGRSPSSPGLLMLHGIWASRAQTAANAAWFAARGFAVLTIDFRGAGQSQPASVSLGWNESGDARGAFDWLKRTQQGAPIGVVGISLGGAAALLGDAGPLPAEALVLQAVYPEVRHAIHNRAAAIVGEYLAAFLEPLLSYQTLPRLGVWPDRLSPLRAMSAYGGSTFVIGGQEDRATPPFETRQIFEAAKGPKELWFVPGLDHGAVTNIETDEYRGRLLDFFTKELGAP